MNKTKNPLLKLKQTHTLYKNNWSITSFLNQYNKFIFLTISFYYSWSYPNKFLCNIENFFTFLNTKFYYILLDNYKIKNKNLLNSKLIIYYKKYPFYIKILSLKDPYTYPSYILNELKFYLYNSIPIRKSLKLIVNKILITTNKKTILGLKLQIKGVLKKDQRASIETFSVGRIPLQTTQNIISYTKDILNTKKGSLSLTIWLHTSN